MKRAGKYAIARVGRYRQLNTITLFDGDPRVYWGLLDPSVEMSSYTTESRKILKSWKIPADRAAIDLEFLRDHFELKTVKKSTVRKTGGWLGPDGTWCPCGDEAHRWTAELIAAKLHGRVPAYDNRWERDDDDAEICSEAWIERRGWMKVYESGVCNGGCTASQAEVLMRWAASDPEHHYADHWIMTAEKAGAL